MHYPNRRQEKKLQKMGFKYIAGLDEVGKGAWAGPLVAAAVILNPEVKVKGIKDSKLLRAPQRLEVFEKIISSVLSWATGIIPEQTIDKIGIVKANILAMEKAIQSLDIKPDFLLIDSLSLNHLKIPSLSIIDGDYKITSIAAASIVAKIIRDQIMDELAEQYPHYGLRHHKGYGTAFHYQMICHHGICTIHRKSFEPIKYFLEE